jgi:hypothetical protein
MTYPIPDDLTPDSYLVLGVAHCFYKADGEVNAVKLIEPIPSASLETLMKQVPTSYEVACALTLGSVFTANGVEIPNLLGGYGAQLCIDFGERAIATARTYRAHPHLQDLIPLATIYRGFNFSLEKKRLLNAKRVIRDEDNVKQHSHTHKVL